MLPERWKELSGHIKDNFKVINAGEEHVEEEGGVDIKFIEFECPMGLMRLEYVSKPVVLDKKTIYSNRIGAETKVDYLYSSEEKNNKLHFYKYDESDDNWVEIDGNNFTV